MRTRGGDARALERDRPVRTRIVSVLLLVLEDERIEQAVRQPRKLEDVIEVAPTPRGHEAFAAVAGHLA